MPSLPNMTEEQAASTPVVDETEINVRVPRTIWQRMRATAALAGISTKALVQEAFEDVLAKRNKEGE